jgi:arylformamidase
MQYTKLSHELEEDSPVHLNLKKPKIIHNSQIPRGDGYNSFIITAENHSGTHIDAPGHFIDGGKTISEYLPDELIYTNPLILDVIKGPNGIIELQDINGVNLNDVDCLFFRTGFEVYRDNHPEKYLTQNPGISPEAVYWIRENFPGINCLGIDTVSMSSYQNPEPGRQVHLNAFKDDEKLGKPLLLIEDMKLGSTKTEELEWVMVVPWQIKGIDSAPCTVIAKLSSIWLN